jgi:hypothetical protein
LLGVVLAKKNLGFGLALDEICQTFCPATVPHGHGVLAANNLGFGLALVKMLAANNLGFGLAQTWLKSAKANLFTRDSATGTCCVPNQWHRAFPTWFHCSLDTHGGNEMVQQCLAWCVGCKQPWFWFGPG